MKRTSKWIVAVAGITTGIAPLGAVEGGAQVSVEPAELAQATRCPEGYVTGSLGISGLDCVGECSLILRGDGSERTWSFSTEPRIMGVEVESPAHGILMAGDRLVAIDGILITTREGGDLYANLEPGTEVRVRFRRDGRVREALLRVEPRCRQVPEPVGVTVREPPPPPRPDEPKTVSVVVAPKVRVAKPSPPAVPSAATVRSGVTVSPNLPGVPVPPNLPGVPESDLLPRGHLGIGFACSECGVRAGEGTEESAWFFSGPLEVTSVSPGGAADEAGVQIGDFIKAIDGHPVETRAGGEAFSGIEVGETVRLTLVKRNGREVEVRVTPREPRRWRAPEGIGVSEPGSKGIVVSEPVSVAEPVLLPFTLSFNPPNGWPLRYSGTVEGVELEVRGEPVSVGESGDDRTGPARTLVIQGQGLWIRITVPRGGQ